MYLNPARSRGVRSSDERGRAVLHPAGGPGAQGRRLLYELHGDSVDVSKSEFTAADTLKRSLHNTLQAAQCPVAARRGEIVGPRAPVHRRLRINEFMNARHCLSDNSGLNLRFRPSSASRALPSKQGRWSHPRPPFRPATTVCRNSAADRRRFYDINPETAATNRALIPRESRA